MKGSIGPVEPVNSINNNVCSTHPLSYTVCTTSDVTVAVITVAQNPTVLCSYCSYVGQIVIKVATLVSFTVI